MDPGWCLNLVEQVAASGAESVILKMHKRGWEGFCFSLIYSYFRWGLTWLYSGDQSYAVLGVKHRAATCKERTYTTIVQYRAILYYISLGRGQVLNFSQYTLKQKLKLYMSKIVIIKLLIWSKYFLCNLQMNTLCGQDREGLNNHLSVARVQKL